MSFQKYVTPRAAKTGLSSVGYTKEFYFSSGELSCPKCAHEYVSKDLKINEYYRFELPNDDTVIYFALVTDKGERGILEVKYNQRPDSEFLSFIDKVPINIHREMATS